MDSWPNPRAPADAPRSASDAERKDVSTDSHLRSTRQLARYNIKATDGEIGHLEDFLFDDETWEIRYAIIDTKNGWSGKKVLIRPQWIKQTIEADREISLNISRESIRQSPAWDPDRPISREYELRLHNHYGYAPYWTTEK